MQALESMKTEFPNQIRALEDKFNKTKDELMRANEQLARLSDIKNEVKKIVDKTKSNSEALNGTLSCLSCLEYLKDPLTLNCGHSICRKCFETHSDPKSKESLVFCEECKIETKNKMLKDQQVMR